MSSIAKGALKGVRASTANGIRPACMNSLAGSRHLLEAGVILCIFWLWVANPDDKSPGSLFLATCVVLLGLLPLWDWLGQNPRDAIPLLPLHGIFYAVCFGLAGFFDPTENWAGLSVTEHQLQWGLIAAILGLVSLYASYYMIAPLFLPRRPRWRWPFEFQENAYGRPAILLFLSFFGVGRLVGIVRIPYLAQYTDALTCFFFLFLLHAYWSGRLKGTPGKVFAYLIMPVDIILYSGLLNSLIAGFVSILVWIGIVQVATRQKLPYKWAVLAVAAFFLLQPVKGRYRALVWGTSAPTSVYERYKLFFGTAFDFYFGSGTDFQTRSEGAATAFDRINHLVVTAAIIADTPYIQPFLYGRTYLPLLTKYIPRFVWPNKPMEDLGNRWARKYGFLAPDDYVTSFNLPWLPEMYMNFGMYGVIAISFLIGILFRFLRDTFWQDPGDSSSFAFGLVLASPLMFVESNLSMAIGEVIIYTIILFAALYLLAFTCPRLVAVARSWVQSR